jgi:hypothetical protein
LTPVYCALHVQPHILPDREELYAAVPWLLQ